MSIREIIAALGGDRQVAAAIGRRPSAVRNWIRDGYVPPQHHPALVEMANEAGITVTAAELDPDLPTPCAQEER